MNAKRLVITFVLLTTLGMGGQVKAEEVRLSVAASMTDAVKELITTFVNTNPAITIVANFASSGALAKQISLGAPAHLYISANRKWMDYLVDQHTIDPKSVTVFAYNSLVFVGPANDKIRALTDLVSLKRVALGSPRSVPAGQYAAQAMIAAGIYGQLEKAHKLMMAKDVRQALIYAERGEVDGAFVYRTDALLARQAVILFTVEPQLHEAIAYPLGLTMAGAKNEAARAFAAYLKTPAARMIIEKYGFMSERQP